MSGYLARVAARAIGVAPVLRPRGTSRFEASALDPVPTPRSPAARSARFTATVPDAPPERASAETPAEDAGDDATERPRAGIRPPSERHAASPRRPQRAREVAAAKAETVETPVETSPGRAGPARPDDARERGRAAPDPPPSGPPIEGRVAERAAFEVSIENAPTSTPRPAGPERTARDVGTAERVEPGRVEPEESAAGSSRSSAPREVAAREPRRDAVDARAVEATPHDRRSPPPFEEAAAAPVASDGRPVESEPLPAPRARPVRTVVEIPSTPAESRRVGEASAPAPEVRVTIGRIEVTAAAATAPPAPASKPAPSPRAPRLSLDEYLERRNGAKP